MADFHPDVKLAFSVTRELRHRIAEVRERADAIVARRPSPSGLVIPEVDATGRLRDLFLAPGTCDRFDNHELVADIMAAIIESTEDAQRQYRFAMHDPDSRQRPISEIVREWRAEGDPGQQVPNFGKVEE
ncbi:hypothetical protein [Nocardia mexicana]|uniref:YbaB/EbfC DNA-binding family protein n=1 Tax=Nocardia mexicana TaxID=279262 RepID=A0A370HC92_9NOCA|nr:hypothetical protein [Nocardia mexicana]RDI54549.1 hypothetical protein DFR68_102677 [Nocardia mexicana]